MRAPNHFINRISCLFCLTHSLPYSLTRWKWCLFFHSKFAHWSNNNNNKHTNKTRLTTHSHTHVYRMEKECVVPFRCARAKQMTMTNVQQQYTHIANSVSVIWFKLGKFWDKIVSNFLLRSFKLLAIFFFDLKSWVHNCPQFNRHFTLSLCIETCVNCWNAEHRRISSTQALEFVNYLFFSFRSHTCPKPTKIAHTLYGVKQIWTVANARTHMRRREWDQNDDIAILRLSFSLCVGFTVFSLSSLSSLCRM